MEHALWVLPIETPLMARKIRGLTLVYHRFPESYSERRKKKQLQEWGWEEDHSLPIAIGLNECGVWSAHLEKPPGTKPH
jgi:hypothetical protein